MQPNILLYSAVLTSLASFAAARASHPSPQRRPASRDASLFLHRLYAQDQQAPLNLNPEDPASTPNPSADYSDRGSPSVEKIIPPIPMPSSDPTPPDRSSDVTLSDVLPKTARINIFASFTRDISTVSDRLDDQSVNTTVLAPLNSALQSLPRKPWEDAKDYDRMGANAYAGDEGEDRAHWNLRRFVEGHVVVASPWNEGEKAKTMGGQEVWWKQRDGKKVVMPGEVQVDGVAEKVGNGEVWLIKGVMDYAQ